MDITFEQTVQNRTMHLDLTQADGTAESLQTICTDILLICININSSVDIGSEKAIRDLFKYYLHLFDRNCRIIHINSCVQKKVKYALVSLLDERMMKLPQKWSKSWSSHPLQLDCFDDMLAGERFFEYLDSLLINPHKNIDAMEVYFLCLCLGFKGKYENNNKKIEEYITQLARAILSSRPTRSKNSSSVAHQPSRKQTRAVLYVKSWVIICVTLSIMISAWFTTFIVTNSLSKNLFFENRISIETNQEPE